jgi:hypothetical protein
LRSLGATSCGFARTSRCVGFCVALLRGSSFSSGKTQLFSILLGELWLLLARSCAACTRVAHRV